MTVLDLPLTLDDRPLPRRVGLVTLATDHTTEVDFAALSPRGIGVYATRIPLPIRSRRKPWPRWRAT
ncbi:hypothetical protein ACFSYD_18380 [Paracoccus aerius]